MRTADSPHYTEEVAQNGLPETWNRYIRFNSRQRIAHRHHRRLRSWTHIIEIHHALHSPWLHAPHYCPRVFCEQSLGAASSIHRAVSGAICCRCSGRNCLQVVLRVLLAQGRWGSLLEATTKICAKSEKFIAAMGKSWCAASSHSVIGEGILRRQIVLPQYLIPLCLSYYASFGSFFKKKKFVPMRRTCSQSANCDLCFLYMLNYVLQTGNHKCICKLLSVQFKHITRWLLYGTKLIKMDLC